MIRKGKISSADNINRKARVTFQDLDDNVTAELITMDGVPELSVNDIVIVAFFTGNSLKDGVIIGRIRG
jgi:hypothetical protein